MSRKNFLGRALRSGLLATAAATLLMGNMAAFAAEDDEFSGFFWQQNVISGTVTGVGTDSLTISVNGAMEQGGFGLGMPEDGMQQGRMGSMPEGRGMGMPQNGETPPELPDGQTPPELPDGERPEFAEGERPEFAEGERPELPEGERPEFTEGERPELSEGGLPDLPQGMEDMTGQPQGMPQGGGMPEGGPQGGGMPEGGPQGSGFGMGMPSMGGQFSSEVTVTVDSDTAIIKADGTSGTFSDISVGSAVMVMYEGDTALSILIAG